MNKLLTTSILFAFLLTACTEAVVELQEDIHSAEDNLLVEKLFYSTFDIVDDLISSNEIYTYEGSTLLPSDVKIINVDSTFNDGDGLEVILDFGRLGKELPLGTLCPDGIYRSGKLHIKIKGEYILPDNVINCSFAYADEFYSGNGETMNQLVGNIAVTRISPLRHKIEVHDAFVKLADTELLWSCEREIELKHDAGSGAYGDTYEVTGTASGTNRLNIRYHVSIDEALIKTLEKGCARVFKSGIVTIEEEDNDKLFRVDYDPYDNSACDQTVLIEVNGKRSIYTLD